MPVPSVASVAASSPVAAVSSSAEALLLAGQAVEATLLDLISPSEAVLSLGGRTVQATLAAPADEAALAAGQRVLLVLPQAGRAGARTDAPRPESSIAPNGRPPLLTLRPGSLSAAFAAALPGDVAANLAVGAATHDGASPFRAQPLPPHGAVQPADAAALLKAALPSVVAAQAGAATLFADLPRLLADGVPEPLREAARAVLAFRLEPGAEGDPDGGPALRGALERSGLFFERSLRAGLPPADLKAALLTLKAALTASETSALQARPDKPAPDPSANGSAPRNQPVAPPLRSAPLRGEAAAPPTLPLSAPAASAADAVRHGAEAALARIELAQIASLDQPASAPFETSAQRQWTFELPLALGAQTGVAQFRLVSEREGGAAGGSGEGARRWSLRFSVDAPDAGSIGAEVTAQGGRVAVAIRAEQPDTAQRLREEEGALLTRLENGGVRLAGLDIRAGRFPAPPAPPGRLLDRRS